MPQILLLCYLLLCYKRHFQCSRYVTHDKIINYKYAKLVYILKARHRGRGNARQLEIPKPRDLEIQIEV